MSSKKDDNDNDEQDADEQDADGQDRDNQDEDDQGGRGDRNIASNRRGVKRPAESSHAGEKKNTYNTHKRGMNYDCRFPPLTIDNLRRHTSR